MKKILSLTLSAALLSAAAPGYAIDLSGNYANDYENLETAVNGKVDSSTIFSNGVFDTQNTNANGTVARIWNEADGGGTQIIDGRSNVKAYTGVHEGSDGTNIYVQTYAIDKDNKTGTRINVNKEGAYYTTGKNTYTFGADDEIATKGDLKALASGTSGNKISTDALDDTLQTAISTVSTNTTAINTNKENITALQTTVGDSSNGLVADVATLKNVVHQESDGIHIGEHSFIFDDANGKITYKDSTDTEQAIDFTTTPTVNGKAVATQEAVDAVADTVATNTTAINTNKDNIAALQTTVGDASSGLVKAVADNTSAIATNTTDIAANSTAIASLQTTVATKQDKLTSTQLAAVDSGITSDKVTQIATNTANITALQSNKQDNLTATQMAAVDSGITSDKVTQIATNTANITALQGSKQDNLTATQMDAVNSGITSDKVTQIATNTANITALQGSKQDNLTATQMAAVNSGIDSTKVAAYDGYDARITANANNIADLQTGKQDKLTDAQIAAANSGITTDKVTQIEVNKTNIAHNASDIATNTANIASNTSNIAANTTAISTNTANIATNATNIAANTGKIDTNTSHIGSMDFTGTQYLTGASSLTTAATLLDAQVKQNADGIATLNGGVNTPGSVLHSIHENAATAAYNNDNSHLAATTLQGAIDENAAHIGGLNYTSNNYVASGDNLTTAVGKLDGQVKTNADGIATNATNIGSMDFTGTNYLTGVSSLTDATKALDGQVKTNADNIGDMSFTGTSAAGATTLTGAVNKLDAAIGNKTFITNASGATDVTDAINKTNTALGDVSTLDGYNITTNNVTGAVNELDAAIGDVSTLAAAKGRDVKTTADVTSAIKAMDADFHRADDGRIHIGTNSFILDDSNGNFSYEDPNGVERPINFTQTPTVNGTPLATTREVDHLRDESRTGIASVAALTALQPLGIESGRLQFAVGSGFYQGESALAAGANYYVTDNLVLNAGGAMDTSLDNHVIKAGLSVGFFKPKKARTINANNVVINAAQHTTVKASKDVAYVTPEQLKALMDRIEVLEKELAKRK